MDQCDYVVGFSVKCVTPGRKYYSISTGCGSHCSRSLRNGCSILVKPAFYNQDEIGLRDHLGFFLTKRVIERMHPISHLECADFPALPLSRLTGIIQREGITRIKLSKC